MPHRHSSDTDGRSESNLRVAFLLNLGFTVLEVAGGLWTNSVAILTDALHDAGDVASLGLAWYFERLSARGRTSRHTYGFARYRLLGGLVTGLVLIAGLGFVLWHAGRRLIDPEPVNAPGMMLLAVLGVVVNGAAVWRVKKGASLTEKVVSWHLLEDTLGWVAVLAGAGVMAFSDLPIIDPLLSIAIALFVLWNVGRNLARVMRVFLQSSPESFDADEFSQRVKGLPGVADLHHLHVWSLDGERHVLSAHVVVEAGASREKIRQLKRRVRAMLDDDEFEHLTLDVELQGEECSAGGR